MSTILKALKKAEDGRAKETFPGRITAEERPPSRGRLRLVLAAAAFLLAIAAAAIRFAGPFAAGRAIPLRPAAPNPSPSPARAEAAAVRPEPEPAPLRLSGVIWDPENPVALVNGLAVSPGEEVSGARVVKIAVEGVTFSRGGKEFTVTVHE